MLGQKNHCKCAQTAAGTVANNRIANFSGRGESVANCIVCFLRAELQHKPGTHPFLAGCCHSEEFSTLAQNGKFLGQVLGAQALTALGATAGNDLAAGLSCHTRAKTMAAGANNLAGLKGTFHVSILN
jgi:hypothetical protein